MRIRVGGSLTRPQRRPTTGRDQVSASSRETPAAAASSRDAGCVVVVRPDQHVAQVLPLGAYEALTGFLGGITVDAAGRPPAHGR